MMNFKILELYSGIGGMHCAVNESEVSGGIVAAVDINTIANQVYKHNFPNTTVLNRNIQSMKPDEIEKLGVNAVLMSPPCQPFTRNGKCLDMNDARTSSFIYFISIIEQLKNVEYILMENVKGFECSAVRDMFINKLQQCDFQYQEFLLCPTIVGVPNSRLRYYCIARRSKNIWSFKTKPEIMKTLLNSYDKPYSIKGIIEEEVSNEFQIPDKLLKRANVLDICQAESTRTCCFTKAYSYYVEGTGSVLTTASVDMVELCYKNANSHPVGTEEFVAALKPLRLRFFTPQEILLLMSFPIRYQFPPNVTRRQCYRLLGNSVNVRVISELIKILFS